jgi:hypothetical protein
MAFSLASSDPYSGTGASASTIYPLIACRVPSGILLPPVWSVTRHVPLLDFSMLIWMPNIDLVSLVSAQANIDPDNLSERITPSC